MAAYSQESLKKQRIWLILLIQIAHLVCPSARSAKVSLLVHAARMLLTCCTQTVSRLLVAWLKADMHQLSSRQPKKAAHVADSC